jgi:hypothetical protein
MLPQPGDRNFLADLIHHVRNELPPDADFDRQIFVGLLLCLVAGGKNLVVELNETASAKTGLLQRQRVGAMVRYVRERFHQSSNSAAGDERVCIVRSPPPSSGYVPTSRMPWITGCKETQPLPSSYPIL